MRFRYLLEVFRKFPTRTPPIIFIGGYSPDEEYGIFDSPVHCNRDVFRGELSSWSSERCPATNQDLYINWISTAFRNM